MCTAITYQTRDHYFGRTLDYDTSFGEEVTLTPRNFPLTFRHLDTLERHHAILGMACVAQGYPLYYDGVNEKGLAMAGLNFPYFARYSPAVPGRENVAHFELIPWILGTCATVAEAREKIAELNVTDDAFSDQLPPSTLHWIISGPDGCLVLETTDSGVGLYDNPVGVLTNSPPFDQQLLQLNNFMHLSPLPPENRFSRRLRLGAYSRGMGALGLPGDLSSQSRFARAAFVRLNSLSGDSEEESVSQFFHILGSVEQPMGCCRLENGCCERTIYTCCCNASRGIYYYTTYESHGLRAVDMHRENLNSVDLRRWQVERQEQVQWRN